MAVVSRKEYIGVPRDALENYKGKQLLFISWDHHMLVAAPIMFRADPQLILRELLDTQLMPLLQSDPDAAAISWDKVEWLKGTESWVPDYDRSLADNGIRHKQQLRMRTPGLNTLCSVS
jgi:phenol hydroxylase P4 protein